MESETIDLKVKRIEQALVRIGADIADASEYAEKAREAAADSANALIKAQQKMEELYIGLNRQ